TSTSTVPGGPAGPPGGQSAGGPGGTGSPGAPGSPGTQTKSPLRQLCEQQAKQKYSQTAKGAMDNSARQWGNDFVKGEMWAAGIGCGGAVLVTTGVVVVSVPWIEGLSAPMSCLAGGIVGTVEGMPVTLLKA